MRFIILFVAASMTACVPPPPVANQAPVQRIRVPADYNLDSLINDEYKQGQAINSPKCVVPVGGTARPVSFDEAKASLGNITSIKGEFETSADYLARISREQRALPNEMTIRGAFDSEYAIYDADTQYFTVTEYALDNVNANYNWAKKRDLGIPLDPIDGYGGIALEHVSDFDNQIDVVTPGTEKIEGVYEASNVPSGSHLLSPRYLAHQRLFLIGRRYPCPEPAEAMMKAFSSPWGKGHMSPRVIRLRR